MTNEVDIKKQQDEDDLQLDENNLGIAGRITRQFINSPVTPLLMLAFLGIEIGRASCRERVEISVLAG